MATTVIHGLIQVTMAACMEVTTEVTTAAIMGTTLTGAIHIITTTISTTTITMPEVFSTPGENDRATFLRDGTAESLLQEEETITFQNRLLLQI